MNKFIKIKNTWHSTETYYDLEELEELLEQYTVLYPTADLDYDVEDCGEWVEFDYPEDKVKKDDNRPNGYWQEMLIYKLLIRFNDTADEAEFIMRESR